MSRRDSDLAVLIEAAAFVALLWLVLR